MAIRFCVRMQAEIPILVKKGKMTKAAVDASVANQEVLKPDAAQLRYQGIWLITSANPSSPELPRYDKLVSRRQYWRDLIGYHLLRR